MAKKVKETENIYVEEGGSLSTSTAGAVDWKIVHECTFVPEATEWLSKNAEDGKEYRIITEHRHVQAKSTITLEAV